jgi:hypothetical protein
VVVGDVDFTDGYCNIPGLEARKRENTRVCIAFMHRKSAGFSRVHLKPKVIEVSLVSMELMCVIHTSAINFDMTFVDLLCFKGEQFEFRFKYERQKIQIRI